MACGYFQIHQPYYTDCKQWGDWGKGPKITMAWEQCSKDYGCAKQCVLNYMARYTSGCTGGRTPTCEDYSRVHNGGPSGCKISATIGYWNKVKACYGTSENHVEGDI